MIRYANNFQQSFIPSATLGFRKSIAEIVRRFADSIDERQGSSTTLAPRTRPPIYLYFDESGDLDFKTTGTRYYLGGVLVISDPWELSAALNVVREEVFRGKFINQKFHASEDRQATRDRVFKCIRDCGGFEHHAFIFEKATIPISHQEQSVFYTTIADFALRQTIQLYPTAEPIYVITDRLPVQRKRDAVIKGFQNCLAAITAPTEENEALQEPRRYEIGHHGSEAHPCLQVADYVNWAIFKKWERGDLRSYDLIKAFVRQEVRFDGRLLRA